MQAPPPQYLYHPRAQHTPEPHRAPSHEHDAARPPQAADQQLPPMQQPPAAPADDGSAHMQQLSLSHPHAPYPATQYPYANGGAMQNNMAANGMRYPLPQAPLDARHAAAGRHKKEIKRRTKTGCLTCRKRRIKCDETHPACRNCQKSKRDCLGYDPIFKPSPGPAAIQPAPAAAASAAASTPDTATPHLPHSHHSPAPYSSAADNPPTASSREYPPSLDPALGGESTYAMAQHDRSSALQPSRRVRHVTMDDLFSLGDIMPQYQVRTTPPPVSLAQQQEIAAFFIHHYAPGLDRLLETPWYSQHGLQYLQQNLHLHDFVVQCAESFKQQNASDINFTNSLPSLDARLVWQLACLPRMASQSSSAHDPELDRVLPRLAVLEHLLTGQFLDPRSIPPPPQHPPQPNTAPTAYNEHLFWHHLGRFVSIHDDHPDPAAQKEIADSLGTMRLILCMLENRDVLYSMAIARHFGGRLPDFRPDRHLVPTTSDPDDVINKLKVAQHFVETEDQRGTSQVVQRVCGMAMRSWTLAKR